MQPSEIDRLQYYEYEYMLEEINKDIKEQEKRQKEQEKEQKKSMGSVPNYNQIMRSAQSSMPHYSMPKV